MVILLPPARAPLRLVSQIRHQNGQRRLHGGKIKHLIDTSWIGSLGDRRENAYEAHHPLIAGGSFDPNGQPYTSGGPGKFLQTTQPPQLSRVVTWKAMNGGQLDAIFAHVGGNDRSAE